MNTIAGKRKQLADEASGKATQAVCEQLAAAGIPATLGDGYMIIVDFGRGQRAPRRFRLEAYMQGCGYYSTGVVAGWSVRFDSEGLRGMGTITYPLRKDGTIDATRLQRDIQSWHERECNREDAEAERRQRIDASASEFSELQRIANALCGAASGGLYITAENTGRAEGRPVQFKISGHASCARVLALLKAVEDTKEL